MNEEQRKHSSRELFLLWWCSLRRPVQIVISLIMILSVSVAIAAGVYLWNKTSALLDPGFKKFIVAELSGIPEEYDDIQPGDSIAAAPVLTNQGDIDATSFITLKLPLLPGTVVTSSTEAGSVAAAYDWSIGSGWTEIDRDVENGKLLIVYAYGTSSELSLMAPGEPTSALTSGFTLKGSITGAQFKNMTDISIEITGYLASEDYGVDPLGVWEQRVE